MRQPDILLVSSASSHDAVLTTNDEFTVRLVTGLSDAVRSAGECIPDLILLDLADVEHEGDSFRSLKKLQLRCPSTPIVITCPDCTAAQRVNTLQAGADDVFCEPLTGVEALEKIRVKLRRVLKKPLNPEIYNGAHLFANFAEVEVRVDGQLVTLTRRELELLAFLVEHRNRLLSREVLLHGVWRTINVSHPRTVDTHILRLRKKLGIVGRHIETVPRFGWRFVEKTLASLAILQLADLYL